jgi:GNAT superfamily N-acetyltransferase
VSDEVSVKDGRSILVRPIRSDDKRLLATAFDRLSPESRYRRFFSPIQRLGKQDLVYLTEIDHSDHEALAAINPENGAIIGVARYVRSADPTEAEVAVTVADPWQRRGVATALLERLVERAREEGIDHFVALVMSDNVEALDLFRGLAPGRSHSRRSPSGHIELLIPLPEPGELAGSRLGRLLGATARGVLTLNPWPVMRRAIIRHRTEELELPTEPDE